MIHYAIADAGHFLPAVVERAAGFGELGGSGQAQACSEVPAGFAAQTEA